MQTMQITRTMNDNIGNMSLMKDGIGLDHDLNLHTDPDVKRIVATDEDIKHPLILSYHA